MSRALMLLHLLADRNLAPAGCRLDFGEVGADGLAEVAARPDFESLARTFPCLIDQFGRAALPSDVLAAFQGAGCALLDESTLLRADDSARPQPAPAVRWIAGDWYFMPPPKPQGNQIGSRALAMKLVQLVCADAETRELEEVFRADPGLSYHLLRLVNSAGVGVGRRITSFSQAIIILGRAQLRRWLNLMLFAAGKNDPRAPMLLARAAVRARGMELIAQATGLDRHGQDQAFMVGMFSLLGILFGQPLAGILQPLQIGEAVSSAVLRHEGDYGRLLRMALAAEAGRAGEVGDLLAALNVAPEEFVRATLAAHAWMLAVVRDVPGSDNG